jgi:hypothetical protein
MSDPTNLSIAYHEGGHALAAFRLGFRLRSISIVSDGESFGRVRGYLKPTFFRKFDQEAPTRKDIAEAHDRIVALLAGGEAQRKFRQGSVRRNHVEHDMQCIHTLLERLFQEDERTALMKYLRIRAKLLIHSPTNWRMITALAEALVERPSLKGREVAAVFVDALRKQRAEQRRLAHVSRQNSNVILER